MMTPLNTGKAPVLQSDFWLLLSAIPAIPLHCGTDLTNYRQRSYDKRGLSAGAHQYTCCGAAAR